MEQLISAGREVVFDVYGVVRQALDGRYRMLGNFLTGVFFSLLYRMVLAETLRPISQIVLNLLLVAATVLLHSIFTDECQQVARNIYVSARHALRTGVTNQTTRLLKKYINRNFIAKYLQNTVSSYGYKFRRALDKVTKRHRRNESDGKPPDNGRQSTTVLLVSACVLGVAIGRFVDVLLQVGWSVLKRPVVWNAVDMVMTHLYLYNVVYVVFVGLLSVVAGVVFIANADLSNLSQNVIPE